MNVAPRSVSTPTDAPVRSMNVHLGINTRFLRQACDDRAQPAVAKPQDRDGAVFDFDGRVIEIGPVAADLGDLVVHQPVEQVEHVGRLVDEHAAALGDPASSPGIRLIVSGVAPAIHRENAQHGPADLACIDRRLHAPDGFVPPPLADHAQLRAGTAAAAASIASQSSRLAAIGFSTSDVDAGLGRPECGLGVQRVGRADA